MSNFGFLQKEWSSLYQAMKKAEERVNTEPVSAAFQCRYALEESLHHIFDLEHFDLPYNKELVNLITNDQLKSVVPLQYMDGLHIVRKTGNNAVHYGNRVQPRDALISLKYLYQFLKWFAYTYSEVEPTIPGTFDETCVPKIGEAQKQESARTAELLAKQQELENMLAQLQAERDAAHEKALQTEAAYQAYQATQETQSKALEERKKKRVRTLKTEFTEAETREHIIDVNLKEAGWFTLNHGRELEYPVKGMPVSPDNPNGNGYVDYVLWDDNGKPLALIEAKKTTRDLEVGKHQAWLYANCLEQMFGQRPVIFYTNGYETKIWEDKLYAAPRSVYGFYTKPELQWMIQKHHSIQDLRKAKINTNIAGRTYQMEAIQRVAETFVTDGAHGIMGKNRSALLVMATGSGKTRTAAALVEVLFKHNWVKRVLFLADRNALVKQAKDNFNEYLPNLSSVNLSVEKENDTTRLVFSTYPSMLNKIDGVRNQQERFYGTGHFDLIIVDEAHRSVYNRYKAIFEYFDALLVGLTATPKDGIDHNTFELFGCSNEDPTFLYQLDEAVAQNYLVPYKNISITTSFLEQGIKYKDLSDKDKEKYELTFEDKTTGLFPEEIRSNAINKWLFNKDTVNKVLDKLMLDGLRIEGGDKIGRTIIFAVNQNHAKFIENCFLERYPNQPPGFIATVHNEVSHAQSLIDSFCDKYKENLPQIAVSVDMMYTGVDAPRVVNLVFFKQVRSYAKFWQMIGRGTRLCPDIFGPGMDKEYFMIFDVCANFEFFDVTQYGADTKLIKPITQQIFDARVQLSLLLMDTKEPDDAELAGKILDVLHKEISELNKNRFQVKMHLRYVEEFSKRERWNKLNSDDAHIIETYLSELPDPETINEMARRFDLMMLKLQIATLRLSGKQRKYESDLMEIAEGLSSKYTIPVVKKSQPLIENLKDPDFYSTLTQRRLDEIRIEIRELVQYLDTSGKKTVYTDIQDSEIVEKEPVGVAGRPHVYGIPYKKRVESFVRDHKDHLTINKLSSNQPITTEELRALEQILFDGEERGTKEDFEREYGKEPLGVFIRSILGLSVSAAQDAFAEFLNSGSMTADQMTFIQTIIQFLTKNGTIDPAQLFETPFTDRNQDGLIGVFDEGQATKIINIVERINENAQVG
jgi:type I restriction enzyme, R subunit